jgi:hypothetical protein
MRTVRTGSLEGKLADVSLSILLDGLAFGWTRWLMRAMGEDAGRKSEQRQAGECSHLRMTT